MGSVVSVPDHCLSFYFVYSTDVVYKGLGCIESGSVPHIDYVYVEAISKSNA